MLNFPALSSAPGTWHGRLLSWSGTQVSTAHFDGCYGLDCVRAADGSNGPQILKSITLNCNETEWMKEWHSPQKGASWWHTSTMSENGESVFVCVYIHTLESVRVGWYLIVFAFCVCRCEYKITALSLTRLVWSDTLCCEVNSFCVSLYLVLGTLRCGCHQ